jgi:hypothetical protein
MTFDFGLRHLSGAQVAQGGKGGQTDLRHCATALYRGGVVERSRVVVEQVVYAPIGLALERPLAGLDTLGVNRATALKGVPPNRRRAYEFLEAIGSAEASTTAVAKELGLPTNTARRILEDLTAYGLVERLSQGQGKPDNWARLAWEEE